MRTLAPNRALLIPMFRTRLDAAICPTYDDRIPGVPV